jgi:hypothetical protein
VRRNKVSDLKLKLKFFFKMKKCHLIRRTKPMIPIWRNHMRRKEREELATYVARRVSGRHVFLGGARLWNGSGVFFLAHGWRLCPPKAGDSGVSGLPRLIFVGGA